MAPGTPGCDDYLALDDAALLAQCDVHIYRASGPGGQHRNKVSSAVRLHHRPTGVSAQGRQSRSQHQNRRLALRTLRMNIACGHRREVGGDDFLLPPPVAACIFKPRGKGAGQRKRLEVGRRDGRFWPVAAFVLDLLEANTGRLGQTADALGISTGNLSGFLKSERHLLAAAQDIRKRHAQTPLK